MALEYKLSEVLRKEKPTIEDFRDVVDKIREENVFASVNPVTGGRTRSGKFLLEYSNSVFGHTVYEFYELPIIPNRPKEDVFDFLARWFLGKDPWEELVKETDYKEWGFEIQVKDKKITDVYIKRNPFKKTGDLYFLRPRKLYLADLTDEFK